MKDAINNGGFPKVPGIDFELFAKMRDEWDSLSGADPGILMTGDRTASAIKMAYGQGLARNITATQKILNSVTDCFLDSIRIVSSPYVPGFKSVQYRFPRSKKRRIRKKWAKNKLNWRDERVAYIVRSSAFDLHFPKTKLLHSFTLGEDY